MPYLLFHMIFQERVILFTAIILLKILYLRSIIFPKSVDLQIILLELSSALIIFGLLELTKPRSTKVFWLVNFLLSSYFLAGAVYYGYFGQILNFSALRQIFMVKDLSTSIFDLFSLTYLLFYFDLILIAVRNKLSKTKRLRLPVIYSGKYPLEGLTYPLLKRRPMKFSAYRLRPVLLAIILAFTAAAVNIWLYPAKDNRMALTRDLGLLNAQGYALLTAFQPKKEPLHSGEEFSQAAINRLKQLEPVSWPKYYSSASGHNIILVQLESTENFLINLRINDQEITPNLNRLLKESIYFPNFYSQVGQGNTSDAEFITNTSLYPREAGGIATDYIGIAYPSLPRLLKEDGYISLTFHPNVVTFWNRDNLYPCLGFDKYYDREFYQNEDRLGPWGSSDEVLFQKALPLLSDLHKKGQKFFASLITLTNHHPFELPEKRKRISLPPNLEGTLLGNFLTSVNYEDYALGQFIENLKANDLWNNTLFIVFGDHYGLTKSMDLPLQDLFAPLLGRKHDAIDRLNVPLFIRVPGLKPQVIDTLGGQVDILPTLANLLGISLETQLIFGQDILNQEQNLLGFRFYHPNGTLMTSHYFHTAGSESGQDLVNRKIFKDKEFFSQEEQRIKALMNLSDNYIHYLDKSK